MGNGRLVMMTHPLAWDSTLVNGDSPAIRRHPCQAISNGYRAAHRRAEIPVTEECEEACGRCGTPRSVRCSNDLVDAVCASTGRAASTRGFLVGAAGLTRGFASR